MFKLAFIVITFIYVVNCGLNKNFNYFHEKMVTIESGEHLGFFLTPCQRGKEQVCTHKTNQPQKWLFYHLVDNETEISIGNRKLCTKKNKIILKSVKRFTSECMWSVHDGERFDLYVMTDKDGVLDANVLYRDNNYQWSETHANKNPTGSRLQQWLIHVQ
jgi:hypothetical protein